MDKNHLRQHVGEINENLEITQNYEHHLLSNIPKGFQISISERVQCNVRYDKAIYGAKHSTQIQAT